jgi:GT2 family glycosyltransferase
MEAEISRFKKRLQEELEKARALETWVHKISHSLEWRLRERFDHLRRRFIAPPGTRKGLFSDLVTRRVEADADGGFVSVLKSAPKAPDQLTTPDPYDLWLARHALTPERIRQLREEVQTLAYRPKISIVMPVYNTEETWLRRAIESVRSQIYPHWELCICDDGSTAGHVSRVIAEYSREDERIRVLLSPHNRGISAASNGALSLAMGEFVGFLDHDDELTPDALCEVVKLLNEKPDLDFIYTDEDKLTLEGRRVEPFFKPDWSPDLLLSMNYIAHFAVVRRSLVQEIGGFTEGVEGSQDYDLFLRISEKTGRIGHVAKPLYSWRKIPGSAAGDIQAKPFAHEAGRQVLQDHLHRLGIAGKVVDGLVSPLRYCVRYKITGQPLISIIIPIRDRVELLKRCLESIEEKTTYRHFEIVVLDNQSEEPATLTYLAGVPHTVVPIPGPFNYSYLNNVGAAHARGEFLLFLNNDTEVITDEWLTAMLEHAQRPRVGAVGAKLLYPNGTIQHAGVVLGHGGVAGHAFWYLPGDSSGYNDSAQVVRNYSAVTAACMMMRQSVFADVGGFDENIKVAFNDIDLCLRVREKGYLVIYTPHAVLYHMESATRKALHPASDEMYVRTRWGRVIQAGDPYYNPHLSLERFDFSLRILDSHGPLADHR